MGGPRSVAAISKGRDRARPSQMPSIPLFAESITNLDCAAVNCHLLYPLGCEGFIPLRVAAPYPYG